MSMYTFITSLAYFNFRKNKNRTLVGTYDNLFNHKWYTVINKILKEISNNNLLK